MKYEHLMQLIDEGKATPDDIEKYMHAVTLPTVREIEDRMIRRMQLEAEEAQTRGIGRIRHALRSDNQHGQRS